jgi:hypothetical protein
MGTAQLSLEVEQCGAVTLPEVASPKMTSPEVASPEMTSPEVVNRNKQTKEHRKMQSYIAYTYH